MSVLTEMSPCPVPNRHGEPCGRDSAPGMPFPICGEHGIEIWKHLDKLVGGTSKAGTR